MGCLNKATLGLMLVNTEEVCILNKAKVKVFLEAIGQAIKNIKKDAKNQQNASDAIIKELKEKVYKT
eukprot:15334828-Ditylum_brightwellii.AAC.1